MDELESMWAVFPFHFNTVYENKMQITNQENIHYVYDNVYIVDI